ncbi:MAG: hypothetical protein ACLGI6_21670, partial [Gammaproteobacteria bacterium]
MANNSCFGLARSVARRAAVKRAPEPRDKKPMQPMLPSNQSLRRSAQATLRVSDPNEPAEREADAMAERIVSRQAQPELQRACSECEAEREQEDRHEGLGSIAREADAAGDIEVEEDEDEDGIETMNDDSVLSMKSADGTGGTDVPASVVPREAGAALAPAVR